MLKLEGITSINAGTTVPESSNGSLPNRIEKSGSITGLVNQYALFSGTILLKVGGGPTSQNCRCDCINKLHINAVGVFLRLLADASLLPSYPPIKTMQLVGNVVQLAYLWTNKWIMRFNTTRVSTSIYTQKYNALLRRRPLPRLEIFPHISSLLPNNKTQALFILHLVKSAWPIIHGLRSHTRRVVTYYLNPLSLIMDFCTYRKLHYW